MVDISNVVNITVSAGESSLGNYNVNAVLYISTESPVDTWTESYRIYKRAADVGTDWGTTSKTYKDAVAFFAQNPNVLSGNGYLLIAPFASGSETITEALARLSALVYFGGVFTNKTSATATEITNAANAAETMDCIYLVAGSAAADYGSGGILYSLAALNLDHTKLLYYTDSSASLDKVRAMLAAYAGRMFSVEFAAQNTTITANLKTLRGITADTAITETIYNTLKGLGVDAYVTYGGVAKVVSNPNGNGNYFDDVYNRLWFKQTMKVAIFNVLATTGTKIPQTEVGMNNLKAGARRVCEQAVYNGFLAPGKWNGSETFGDPADFHRNIEDFGFFIYSMPIAQQSQEDRLARKAPVIQIAGKQAGAIHSASIIVSFEA
ncbi:MAG: DUF3383 family protein [Methanobrevibacter sp.]|nr:DUF3383 family protein [Methanobrevibacter sp.]